MNNRLPFWLLYKYDIGGILYWETVYWNYSHDPWINSLSYYDGDYEYNGEGVLLYPGTSAGFFGLCPSLRLKAIRDGIEDNYYLKIADSLGLLDDQLNQVAEDWYEWDTDENTLLDTRNQLARLIEGKIK